MGKIKVIAWILVITMLGFWSCWMVAMKMALLCSSLPSLDWPIIVVSKALNISAVGIGWWCLTALESFIFGMVLTVLVFCTFGMTFIRQRMDYIVYTFSVLWGVKKKAWAVISFCFLGFGVISFIYPMESLPSTNTGIFICLISLGSLIWSLWDLIKTFFSSPDVMAVPYGQERPQVSKVTDGYKILSIKRVSMHSDAMVYSEAVNEWLRGDGKVSFKINRGRSARLKDAIRDKVPKASSALLWNVCRKKGMFFNELKVGIGNDLEEARKGKVVEIYKTSYFSSFLTVECQRQQLMVASQSNQGMMAIEDHLPRFVDNKGRLVPLTNSDLSLHIGVTVLAVTLDNNICIWLQSKESEINAGTIVASGSGSLDWSDLDMKDKDFKRSLLTGAKRELKEECGLKDDSMIGETRILGYARWCERGGKPEFFFLSKLNVKFSEVKNNKKEVLQYWSLTNDLQFKNKGELLDSICHLLSPSRIQLSPPLETLLRFLEEYVKEVSDDDLSFLFKESA